MCGVGVCVKQKTKNNKSTMVGHNTTHQPYPKAELHTHTASTLEDTHTYTQGGEELSLIREHISCECPNNSRIFRRQRQRGPQKSVPKLIWNSSKTVQNSPKLCKTVPKLSKTGLKLSKTAPKTVKDSPTTVLNQSPNSAAGKCGPLITSQKLFQNSPKTV